MNITKLKLNNLFGYKDETFDFKNVEGIILIGGKNGVGKSSIFETVTWILSGRLRGSYSKELNNDDVIYIDENDVKADDGCGLMEFIFLDNKYRIIRKVKKSGSTDLQFHVMVKGKWKSLTLQADVNKRTGKRESSITRTENAIFDILGCDANLLMNSIIFEQGNMDTFASSTVGQRKALFKNAIFINKWEDYTFEVKEKLKVVNSEIHTYDTLLDEYESIEVMKEKISTCQNESNLMKNKLGELKSTQKNIEGKIEKYNNDISKIQFKKKEYDEIDYAMQKNKKEMDKNKIELEDNEKDLVDKNKKQQLIVCNIEGCYKNITSIKNVIKKLEADRADIDQDKLKRLYEQRTEVQIKKANVKGKIDRLKKDKNNISIAVCPVGRECKYVSEDFKLNKIKEINLKIFKLNKYNLKINKDANVCYEEIDRIESMVKENNEIIELLVKQNKLFEVEKSNKDNYKMELAEIDSEVKILNFKIKEHKKNIKKLSNDIVELSKNINTLKNDISNHQTLLNTLNNIKKDRDDVTIRVEKIIKDITFREREMVQLEEMIDKYEDIKHQLLILTNKKDIMNFSIKMLGKDIPHLLISNVIPEIEMNANKFLNEMSEGRMQLVLKTEKLLKNNDEIDTLEPWLIVDGRQLKYALCSGGEKLRSDIALHLGYSEFLLNRSNCKLENLLIDESSSALDQEGKDVFIEILHKLNNDYGFKKVFVISHDEKIKKYFDKQILIDKTEIGSKILKWNC